MGERLGVILLFEKSSLPKVFDILFDEGEKHHSPTMDSIRKINDHFHIALPNDFVEFCNLSQNYESWFCSIGENYSDRNHIIRANSLYKNMRRRTGKNSGYSSARKLPKGGWVSIKEKDHIVLRVGHDDNCLIIRGDALGNSDEYSIQYWFPGYENEFGDRYGNFTAYLQSLLGYCYSEASEQTQHLCDKYKE